MTFNEITEPAIREAFAHPREIDLNLVDAQQARRILDRLVGYTLSPLLWRKVRGGLSAGRVQSVAVRLVVEREREIRPSRPRVLDDRGAPRDRRPASTFAAELVRIDGDAARHRRRGDRRRARRGDPRAAARSSPRSGRGRRSARPAPPFTTSTLQQEASRKLGFSPKRTMAVAQRLYEGVETPEGQVGLITYMRTDSTAIAGVAMGEAREVIGERYGEPYTMPKGRVYKTKSKGAQEAHESIRPTSFRRDPDSLAGSLKPDELRLYRLIWQRALASQMAPKELETTTIELADGPYELRASATKVLFDGFARVYTEGRDDGDRRRRGGRGRLPALAEGDVDDRRRVTPTQHFTEPPPRFTEATLIKALEEHGIGRPVDLRGDDLDDPRPRLRPGGGAAAPPGAGRRDRHRPAGRALRGLRRRRVHRADGGGARRGRQRRAARAAAAAPPPRRTRGRGSSRWSGRRSTAGRCRAPRAP